MKYHNFNKKMYLIALILSLFIAGCSRGDMKEQKNNYASLNDVPDSTWQKLSKKKIYFGHQSVGYDIIEGIDLLKQKNTKIIINISETEKVSENENVNLFHSKVGQNRDPKSKDLDFISKIDKGIGNTVDIALYKYCYIDVTGESNVDEIVSGYLSTINKLSKKFPETTFVYMTVPLRTAGITWKTKLKLLMNKKNIWEIDDNIARNEFNILLKEKVRKSPVFDIASLESVHPDGSRETFKMNDKVYDAMYPGYTTDGGHLNDLGKQIIAEQFVLFLINQL
ncbi:hypothetical protein JCM14469_43060 [Desulfatiferula olefinivorans]